MTVLLTLLLAVGAAWAEEPATPTAAERAPLVPPAQPWRERVNDHLEVGGGLGLLAWRSSGRHVVAPLVSARVSAPLWRSLAWTGELGLSMNQFVRPEVVVRTFQIRPSAVVEGVLERHHVAFRAGLGGALALQPGSVGGGDLQQGVLVVDGGLRLRTALDAELSPRFRLQLGLGAVVGPRGLDYDASIGFGVQP